MSAGGVGVLLTVAYDGRPFAGFATQRDQRTVAGELLGAVRALDPSIREVRGASRTDAGVHARGQAVAFDAERSIPPRGWVLGTTQHLPPEIAVVRASFVDVGFVPRFASAGKHYRYLLLDSRVRDPFLVGRVMRVDGITRPEVLARARREASLALGTHDFAAFRASGDPRTNTVRTLRRLDVSVDPADPRLARVDVEGDAFLYNMVRILVGTIVEVAQGRRPEGAIARALASRDRADAGLTAPPDGLYLERVFLREEGRESWP